MSLNAWLLFAGTEAVLCLTPGPAGRGADSSGEVPETDEPPLWRHVGRRGHGRGVRRRTLSPYELQRGGNRMLRLRRKRTT